MLGIYTFIPAKEAGAIIKFLKHGEVLALATAYDDAKYAEVIARMLLYQFKQFDSAIVAPFTYGQEIQTRPGKEARREARRAYKEGLLS